MLAAIGLGSNLGNPARSIRRAIDRLRDLGDIVARSRLYGSRPWGWTDQPDFCNAVVLLETRLSARDLLTALQQIERALGRTPGERWGPRVIDLDILLYGDRNIDEPGLQIPHPRLWERGFALIPLAEVDPRHAGAVAGLPPGERESVALMSEELLVERVRALAEAFLQTDLMRLRITDHNEDAIELRRKHVAPPRREPITEQRETAAPALQLDRIKADLVGIVRLSRPGAREGEKVEGDRELAYVEALGIRTPVRSLGGGRVVNVLCTDGQPVEYGQVLFEIDRG